MANCGRIQHSGDGAMIIRISEEELSDMLCGLGNPGACISCGYLEEYAGCEPDAREYPCPECGEHTLYGLEEVLMMGFVEVE